MAKGSEMVKFVSPGWDFDTTNAIRVFLTANPKFEVQVNAEEDGYAGVDALAKESWRLEPVGKIGE